MNNSTTLIIVSLIVSFLFSLIFTPFIIKICKNNNLFDQPNGRKVHKLAIPRLGGTLFMPSMGVGVTTALIIQYGGLHENFDINISAILLSVGALLIYLIGILDDLNGMKAWHKFIIQFVTALFFPLCNLSINNLHGLFGVNEIPIFISYPLTLFVILLIVNAMNLIDGIDGLSSSLAILILIALTFLFQKAGNILFTLISAGLAGAIFAFFIYNVFGSVGRFKIFMGDAGSLFIGYVIAYLTIKYQMCNEAAGLPYREESLLISWTLVFIPCIDVIRVALMRKINGKEMFEADMTHIHHRIMQAGLSMHQTLCAIILLFISFCSINFGLYGINLATTWILLLDIIIYFIFITMIERLRKTN